jgi:AcrR family transcriptional regulator
MTAAQPLPRGRHRLSRDEVVRSQRERLQRALADLMAINGYANTSVADILRAARVSRETFYEQFSSKEDCFMSAFEEAYARLVSAALTEPVTAAAPADRLDHLLGAYLEAIAAEPTYARVFLVEVHAAGPAALRRRAELQRGLVDALAGMVGATPAQHFAIEAAVAAISAMVTTRLAEGDIEGLLALREPLVELAGKVWST